MLKFLLGVGIVAFTSFCGYLFARKYRQRNDFFSQFKEFNERFLSEISYYRRPIREFMGAYSYRGEFQEFLQAYNMQIEEQGYKEGGFMDMEEYSFLTNEEKRMIKDYFLMLGRGDSSSQKSYFSSVKIGIDKLQVEAEIQRKRYGDLYIKLGFLCGLFILILII